MRGALEVVSEFGQHRSYEEIANRHFHVQRLPDADRHTDSEQGMASQVEEVIMHADSGDVQELRPERGEFAFYRKDGSLLKCRQQVSLLPPSARIFSSLLGGLCSTRLTI